MMLNFVVFLKTCAVLATPVEWTALLLWWGESIGNSVRVPRSVSILYPKDWRR